MSAPVRCLVTGATGFVGSRLVRRLQTEAREVHILVRPSTDLVSVQALGRTTTHMLETSCTASAIAAITAARPESTFHLAACVRSVHGPEDVDALVDSNVKFTAQVLEGLAAAGARRIVVASTAWQHYGGAGYDPVNLYAATKQAAEDVLRHYCNAQGISAIVLVLSDTYGANDRRGKLFKALDDASRAETPVAFSPGDQFLDLVHGDDVAEAFLVAERRLMASGPGTLERFAVTSGQPVRLRDVALLYEELAGRTLRIEWGGRPHRAREVMMPSIGAPPLPDWTPRVDLRRGIAELATRST